jgi:adenylate cyclase
MPGVTRYRLTSTDGLQQHELRAGVQLVVGRAPSSDIAIFDGTVSRRHAELHVEDGGVSVRDLGSSNGTFRNGERIEDGEPVIVSPGDTITFGKVGFKVQPLTPPVAQVATLAPGAAPPRNGHIRPSATIVRQLPVRDSQGALAALGSSDPRISTAPNAAATLGEDKSEQKLATLLEVSKGLGKAADIDALLEKIVRYAYQILDVDRVAIALCDDGLQLTPKIARDKRGSQQPRAVPQSIARKVVEDKVAILSDNAGEDSRFGGQSIQMQQIRSAICCPLIGSEDRVLGVLYVDNVSTTHRFSEHDLEYLIAFAGIAAAGIENQQFAQRIQRELLARENLTRYFAPQVAERIASSREAARLGGEKRPVAVLFSDIRGFTPLSETMNPDDMASLLSEYFTEMVECVFKHDGTLDKFMGDAVMAQWGAPIATGEDADRAIRAAVDMLRALKKLNAKWKGEGRPQLQIGIGVNYGEAFAGNIGSERRLEFTVIGDTVNTAYRLCSAADAGQILITEAMKRALKSPPRLKACPPMELKGKSQPLPVYCVVL